MMSPHPQTSVYCHFLILVNFCKLQVIPFIFLVQPVGVILSNYIDSPTTICPLCLKIRGTGLRGAARDFAELNPTQAAHLLNSNNIQNDLVLKVDYLT